MMACAHHFDLPSPNGPICIGVCRYCGEEREHLNGADIETSPGLRNQPVGWYSWHMDTEERVVNQLLEAER